jgi:hypothetical protein
MSRNNCENFANKCVYSIDFSEHKEMKESDEKSWYTKKQLGDGLEREMEKTRDRVTSLNDYVPHSKNEIRRYTDVHHSKGIEMECSIEVSPR